MQELLHKRREDSQTFATGKDVGSGKAEYKLVAYPRPIFLPDLKTSVDHTHYRETQDGTIVFDRLPHGVEVYFPQDSSSYTIVAKDGSRTYAGPPATRVGYVDGEVVYADKASGLKVTFPVQPGMVQHHIHVAKDSEKDAAVALVAKYDISDYGTTDFRTTELQVLDVDKTKVIGNDLDLSELKAPFIVDPTSTFDSPNDGGAYGSNAVFATVRGAAAADPGTMVTVSPQYADTALTGGLFYVERIYLPFDTSSLADDATVSAASLSLYFQTVTDPDASRVETCLGTWPTTGRVVGDWDLFTYTSGGFITNSGVTPGAYNTLTLNATGRGWISVTGTTKITLIGGGDFDNVAPAGFNQIRIQTSAGANPPSLSVTYTSAASPDITSITPSSAPNNAVVSITNLAGTALNGSSPAVRLEKAAQPDINATSVVQVSATQVTCQLNLSGVATGTWNVVYTDSNGTDTIVNGFTVTDATPTVTSVTPTTGSNTNSALTLDIVGTNLNGPNMIVKLRLSGRADITATDVTVQSSTNATCKVNLTGVT